jgi:hypothetical protein
MLLRAAWPGTALIIAVYADKHWSGEWDVVLVLSAATKGKQAIQDAFLEDIRTSSNQQSPAIGKAIGKANEQPILDLLKRPWFQRIWVRMRERSRLPTQC